MRSTRASVYRLSAVNIMRQRERARVSRDVSMMRESEEMKKKKPMRLLLLRFLVSRNCLLRADDRIFFFSSSYHSLQRSYWCTTKNIKIKVKRKCNIPTHRDLIDTSRTMMMMMTTTSTRAKRSVAKSANAHVGKKPRRTLSSTIFERNARLLWGGVARAQYTSLEIFPRDDQHLQNWLGKKNVNCQARAETADSLSLDWLLLVFFFLLFLSFCSFPAAAEKVRALNRRYASTDDYTSSHCGCSEPVRIYTLIAMEGFIKYVRRDKVDWA